MLKPRVLTEFFNVGSDFDATGSDMQQSVSLQLSIFVIVMQFYILYRRDSTISHFQSRTGKEH